MEEPKKVEISDAIREALESELGRRQLAEELNKAYALFFYSAEEILKGSEKDFLDRVLVKLGEHYSSETSLAYKPRKGHFEFFIKKTEHGWDGGNSTIYKISITPRIKGGSLVGIITELEGREALELLNRYSKEMSTKGGRYSARVEEYLSLPKVFLEKLKEKAQRPNKCLFDKFLKDSEGSLVDVVNPIESYLRGDESFKLVMQTISEEQRRKVIRQIYEIKESNKAMDKWLSESYPSLVEELGREKVKNS